LSRGQQVAHPTWLIRDQQDFARHMDYIHYNPVKHGLCQRAADWPYSTLHRLVKTGVYPADWGGSLSEAEGDFGE
jgi:putative transposase